MKKLLLVIIITLLNLSNVMSHEILDDNDKSKITRNLDNYLQYQRNVLKVKDQLWKMKSEIRRLYKIERWSRDKLSNNIERADSLRAGLSYRFKKLKDYEDEEFNHDFFFAKEILQNVTIARQDVVDKLKAHDNVETLLKDLNILVRRANSKVSQLYRTQKINEDAYRSKRDNNINGDNFSLGFLRNRALTLDNRQEITRIKIEVDEIKQQKKSDFALFKNTHKSYDIQTSESKLIDLKKDILDIITNLEAQIKEERITQRAIFLL